MSPPSLWQNFRQTIGRALRETGQSIHRVALKAEMLAVTPHEYYDDPVLFEDFLSRHRQYFPLLTSGRPQIDANVGFIAPCATLIGTVHVGPGSSIWYGAVVRGDYGENVESFAPQQLPPAAQVGSEKMPPPWQLNDDRHRDRDDHHGGGVFIGTDTNIQDSCIVTSRVQHTTIGNGVTVGHLAQLHSCTIHDYCLIGMGSVINEGVTIHTECLIGAGAVVPPNTTINSGELWLGNPARKVRELTAKDRERLHYQSSEYVTVAKGQRNIMELGGNLDANGSSVYVIPDSSSSEPAQPLLPLEPTAEPLFRLGDATLQLKKTSGNTTTSRKDRGYMPRRLVRNIE